MKSLSLLLAAATLALTPTAPAHAQEGTRHTGPVFTEFGSWRQVENMAPLDIEQEYKAIFDVVPGSKDGAVNSRFDSAARYMNLIVAHGVPRENVHLAVVVHGPSVWDVTTNDAYARKFPGQDNPNAAIVETMLAAGVQFHVCGQSALAQGVTNADLMPGVIMALSQTVATTQLHNQGYTNIP